MKVSSLIFIALAIHCLLTLGIVSASPLAPPYPPSDLIRSVTWHWDSYKTAALGSDLWPVTWGPDDHLYAAWGDGGGFGGSDSGGRVSMGFGRIEGPPEHFRGINVNGGKNHEHPASFSEKGKTAGLVFVEGVKSRGRVRLQKGNRIALRRPWPHRCRPPRQVKLIHARERNESQAAGATRAA